MEGSSIGWFEFFVIMVVIYLMFPCLLYVIFKMSVMGIMEGFFTSLKNHKKEIETTNHEN